MPPEEDVPPGPHRQMLVALHAAYAAAGRPGLRPMALGLRLDDSAPATLNYQAIGKILNGKLIPNPKQLLSLAGWLFREGTGSGQSAEEECGRFLDHLQGLCSATHEQQLGFGREKSFSAADYSNHQVEDERKLLGCMILSVDAIADVKEFSSAGDFVDEFNSAVFVTLLELFERHEKISPARILEEMGNLPSITPSRAERLLHAIVAAAPEPRTAEIYAARMSARSLAREIARAGEEVAELAHSISNAEDPDTEDLVRLVEGKLLAASNAQSMPSRAANSVEGTLDVLEAAGSTQNPLWLTSGFRDLDLLTSGFRPGELIVVAGASRMGKSTLALNFVRACSVVGNRPSFLTSLQANQSEITMRLMSAEARVALHHMTSGNMTDEEWTRLAKRMPSVNSAPVHIADAASCKITEIVRDCRKLAKSNGLHLAVVDSIDLLFPGLEMTADERERNLAAVVRELRAVARELDLTVIALYQLGRLSAEQYETARPEMRHIPWALESAADLVILLHRDDAYELHSPRAGEADLIVAKNRSGPTGVVTAAFQGHYARFVDMSQG
ncbi:replicative DNA helicase [Streptomyces goshikiensis]|uniref:DnaB-like helicase C-terminal domain-containing protein n=1 Tax=Streptomyces goshikiensis TaxID=1942 RepID=UPI003865DED7|nr:replicative DNA helicase [Streptomyces goshikiensis]